MRAGDCTQAILLWRAHSSEYILVNAPWRVDSGVHSRPLALHEVVKEALRVSRR